MRSSLGVLVLLVAIVIFMCMASNIEAAPFFEGFNYPDGQLTGKGLWTGTSTDAVRVASQELVLSSEYANYNVSVDGLGIAPGGDGIVTISMNVHGTDLAWEGCNRWWTLSVYDETDTRLLKWKGVDNELTSLPGEPDVLEDTWYDNDLTGGIDIATVEINFLLGEAYFYFNAAEYNHVVSFSTSGSSVDKLAFSWDYDTWSGQRFYIDDLAIVPEPAMLSLLTLGGLALLRRRKA